MCTRGISSPFHHRRGVADEAHRCQREQLLLERQYRALDRIDLLLI
jgi:hypothetical protein